MGVKLLGQPGTQAGHQQLLLERGEGVQVRLPGPQAGDPAVLVLAQPRVSRGGRSSCHSFLGTDRGLPGTSPDGGRLPARDAILPRRGGAVPPSRPVLTSA
ncbi:hypothetical protein GCM10022262_25790 [Georgenia daeguensis]|uniref:Uncharacterized protein n=1 Tax=Georgenia daeguensis TaxID=908355 RepID=A0ABP8EW61_9MICO